MGSLGCKLVAGLAMGITVGAGVYFAFRGIDYLIGPLLVRIERVGSSTSSSAAAPTPTITGGAAANACDSFAMSLKNCLKSQQNNISTCQSYMDSLTECRRTSKATSKA